jgi:hypothetical protein
MGFADFGGHRIDFREEDVGVEDLARPAQFLVAVNPALPEIGIREEGDPTMEEECWR